MNRKLKTLDLAASKLTRMFDAGEVSEAKYLEAIKRLTDAATLIMLSGK